MENLWLVLTALVAYILGSIPTGYLIVKWATGKSIFDEGSGNMGAMNTYRATGSKSLLILNLLIDAGKAAVALYLAKFLAGPGGYYLTFGLILAALFTVLGHSYSLFVGFRGGKGLACLAGILLVINWVYALISAAVVIASIFETEYFMRWKVKGWAIQGGPKKVFGEQILGRVTGIGIALFFLAFWLGQEYYVVLVPAVALSFTDHIQRLKDFLKSAKRP